MSAKTRIMILQTRHIESISFLTAELVKSFPKDRFDVTLVYLEHGEANALDALADRCVFLGLHKTDYKGLRLKAMKKVRPFLAQHQFDVIIANMYKPVHLLMQMRGAVSAKVCIGIIHAFGEFDRLGRRWMLRFLMDKRWHLVGVSAAVRDYLINARCGLTRNNTSFINNAVDVDAIAARALNAAQAREGLNLPAAGVVFGTLGRCVKGKRHLELLNAFHHFAAAHDDAFLVIIGEGESRPELEAYVAQHQLQGKVFLPGYVSDGMRYLRALDVFVFPSESEGFGIALLEAMALSLPTLVNRVEPLSGIVGDSGLQVDTRDIKALADAIEYYYRLPQAERLALGEAQAQRVRDYYNIAAYHQAYRQLIEQQLAHN